MMRHPWLSLVAVLVLGCGGLPDARQAAVHVEVLYDFNAGCIAVQAEDKAAPDKKDREEKAVLDRAPEQAGSRERRADFAVFRKEDWGRILKITVTAHEQTCTGPVVAEKTEEVTLDEAGAKPLQVRLTAPDEDEDGYVASTGGGTDCIDTLATARPGLTEVCDKVDNNCVGGPDDGLTFADYFRDGDGDGVGAGAAVNACARPADHVTTGNDCDDNNNVRTPGKSEVCDGVDNNCSGGADEGLPTTNYYRDNDGDGVGAGTAVSACAQPAGHVTSTNDCDDNNSARTPGKAEVCDGVDNNCNTTIDDGLPTTNYYRDADGDGAGAGTAVKNCAQPAGHVTNNDDCDDANSAKAPGKPEVCDGLDNNCAGGVDDGLPTSPFHPDADGDGYGTSGGSVQRCSKPQGYAPPTSTFDCDDTKAAVNPAAPEVCNNIDDNCVAGADEGFSKGACMNDVCSGTFVCAADGMSSACNAPTPVSYFPDADGDGQGETGSMAQKVCSGPPPGGKVTNSTDCDDQDPHNKSGGTEVCDDRDNNCSGTKTDEAAICGGKGWKTLTDPVVTSRNWNTVAVGDGADPVIWLAGESGALAFRAAGTTGFTDRNGVCGNTRWNAAWVQSGTGTVFLAGDGGAFAAYNGVTACALANTGSAQGNTSSAPLTGIVGFGSSNTVYAVNDDGYVFSWTPGPSNVPVFKAQRSSTSDRIRDMHGPSASRLLIVGGDHPGDDSLIQSYDSNGSNMSALHTFTGLPNGAKGFHAVWAWDATHAYAVGGQGNVVKWNGTTGWTFANPDLAVTTQFNSVVAFDDSSVYIVGQDGKIRRLKGSSWEVHHTAAVELKDIAAPSRQNIWAVGNGVVVHFPE